METVVPYEISPGEYAAWCERTSVDPETMRGGDERSFA